MKQGIFVYFSPLRKYTVLIFIAVGFMEEWKEIEGFDGKYWVSNLGNVYSTYIKHNLAFNKNKSGNYVGVVLTKNGKQYRYQVHRLVAQAFIPNPNNLSCVNHKNEVQDDNRVDNLEWCTHQYNCTYNNLPKRKGRKISQTIKSKRWTLE